MDESAFLKRTLELADDTVESGSIRIKQGVGGARYEVKNGVKLRTAKAGEEGIDFVHVSSGEKISLKGPYRQNNMDPLPPQAYSPETFAKSALKPNTAVDKVVVDLYGLNDAEKELVKATIRNGNPTKPIEFLE